VKTFCTEEELRQAGLDFNWTYKENWIIPRPGSQTLAQVRRQQFKALPSAA